MNRMVYGVGFVSSAWRRPLPTGPFGLPTKLLCEGELAAAYADFVVADPNPSASYLLAYARVIEQLHRRGPFLPMRYACLLPSKDALGELLRNRDREFLAMLEDVTGCDEFGLRILAGAPDSPAGTRSAPEACISVEQAEVGPGARYLAGRRTCYAQRDARRADAKETAERFLSAFQGLYVSCRRAAPADSDSMVSLCFLVRRQSQGRFRKTFRDLQQDISDKLLLTGPWPPYHFVEMNAADAASGAIAAAVTSAVCDPPEAGESEP